MLIQPIYFLHIPKTAGMSISQWLVASLPDAAACPMQLWDDVAGGRAAALNDYQLFHGHFGANLDRLLGRPARTITVLREPLARTVSHYRHVRRDVNHVWHRRVREQSFEAFVTDPMNRPMIDNFQARYLTELPLDLAPLLVLADSPARAFGRLSVMLEELGFCLSADVVHRAALARLATMVAVGRTDDLPGFCRAVAAAFGFAAPLQDGIPRVNVADDPDVEITSAAAAAVRRLTEVDRDLYERAVQGHYESAAAA